jgi:GPH family glycoside/pentoside/hexuronide:cation symporter
MGIRNNNDDLRDWKIASTGKMVSYSFGFILSLYLLIAYNSLIFYFYEVEVGLEVELVSLAIILCTIWIIISSPILGYITDRPFKFSKKWGFRKPWIITSAIPALIFYFLLYTPPNIDAKSNQWLIFCYLLITSSLFGTFIMIFREHHEGGFPNQFREDFERRRASAIAFIFPGLILFFLSILPLLIIKYGDKSTFALTALISIIIMAICLIFLIPGIYESEEAKNRNFQGYEDSKRLSFLKMLKISLKQKNFRISLIATTLVNIAAALSSASGIYFFKDVLKLPLYLSVFPTIVYFIVLMITVPYWVSFARKHGNANTFILGIFLSGIAYLPFLWITTLEEAIFYSILQGLAYSCYTVMSLPITADCYDEVTLVCEKHQEATLLGIRTISMRSAIIFQALIIGAIHVVTGYNQDPNAIQTPLAVWGVRIHRALIPMVLCFIAFFVMLFWYDLKDNKLNELKASLRLKGL